MSEFTVFVINPGSTSTKIACLKTVPRYFLKRLLMNLLN